MAVKRYNSATSSWTTVAGLGAQGATGADGSAPLTTKGDLLTYSTSATRLGVGNNGETLLADSSQSTGLRYQPVAIGNPIINGGFDIWQRGTSFTAADVYTADRWKKDSQTYSTMTRQTTSDTTNLPTIQYCARVARNSGQTGTAALGVIYSAETADAIRYAGQAVVVSFYARAGANYSAASSNISYNFYTGTGTDQSRSFGVQFTGEANIASSTKTLTTTWQRFSFTATIGATATEWALMFYFNGVGTAGAADYFEITGVQLELGSVATSFKRSGNTLQGELAACQRYFASTFSQGTAPSAANASNTHSIMGKGANAGATEPFAAWHFPVEMRTAPTVTLYNPYTSGTAGQWGNSGGSTGLASGARNVATSTRIANIDNSGNTATAGTQYFICASASAEL